MSAILRVGTLGAGAANCAILIQAMSALRPVLQTAVTHGNVHRIATGDADRGVITALIATHGREKRILLQLFFHMQFSVRSDFCSRSDRLRVMVSRPHHDGMTFQVALTIAPVVSFLPLLVPGDPADQLLDRWPHLVLAPQLENALIAALCSDITHANRCLMRVVRVERAAQEVQPFHHHELHRLIELARRLAPDTASLLINHRLNFGQLRTIANAL